jgi:hypothetical protein
VKSLLPLLSMLFLIGCGPTVQISPPAYTDAQDTGVINIAIQDHHSQTGHPVIHLFPKYQPTQVQNLADKLQQIKPGEYTLTLPTLRPDEYRIVMEAPYTIKIAGIGLGQSTQRTISDFVIHEVLPASCYRFDSKEHDLMKWTSHGVYINNRDKPVSKETCPGLFYINSSWPYPLNDSSHGGSLFVPVSSECFPKSSPQLSQPSQWTFAFVSPDLRDRPDWQHLQSIRFHMATRSINVSVQPEIQYLHGNASHSTLADVQSPSHYDVNGGRWNDYEYAFKLPEKATITHVIFHVYGIPEKTVSDQVDSVYLDAVCPVK